MTSRDDAEGLDRGDEPVVRRSGQAFSAHRSGWDGQWWRCPVRSANGEQCGYWERGRPANPYGDSICPDHDTLLVRTADDPVRGTAP